VNSFESRNLFASKFKIPILFRKSSCPISQGESEGIHGRKGRILHALKSNVVVSERNLENSERVKTERTCLRNWEKAEEEERGSGSDKTTRSELGLFRVVRNG